MESLESHPTYRSSVEALAAGLREELRHTRNIGPSLVEGDRWFGCKIYIVQLVQVLALLLGCTVANADTGNAYPRVSAREQSNRDVERLRILQEELANERTNFLKATAERAERMAVPDAVGAGKAEESQRRAQANIVALEREIRMTSRARESASETRRGRPEATQTGKPGMALAPWWDVYGAAGATALPGIRNTNHSRAGAEKQ